MIIAGFSSLLSLIENLFFILLGFLGMGFLIGFHELGHFLFAKLFNIRVPSFSLGFGPVLLSTKFGETDFCLSAIPFGGYVEIAGAGEVGQGEQKEAHATDSRSFAVKPFYQQLMVMLGGILFNLAFAYAAMIIIFMAGIPKTPLMPNNHVIAAIQPDSAAEKGDLRSGDKIISINQEEIGENLQKIQQIIQPLALKEATIIVERDGEKITKTVLIGSHPTEEVGVLGAEFEFSSTPPHSFKDAIYMGIATCNMWIKQTFEGFATLFSKKGGVTSFKRFAGPVAIIVMMIKSAVAGWQIFLLLLAIISINLAVLNLIPLPILDGGQILFYGIEALIRRPLPYKIREYIHIATWIMFIILFIYLTAQDISRIFGPHINAAISYFYSSPL